MLRGRAFAHSPHPQTRRRPPMHIQRPFFPINPGAKNDEAGGPKEKLAFKGEGGPGSPGRLYSSNEVHWSQFCPSMPKDTGIISGHSFSNVGPGHERAHEFPRRCKGNHSDKRNGPRLPHCPLHLRDPEPQPTPLVLISPSRSLRSTIKSPPTSSASVFSPTKTTLPTPQQKVGSMAPGVEMGTVRVGTRQSGSPKQVLPGR